MTKQEFDENQIKSLKQCLHKAVAFWSEKNKIDTKRITEYYSISQTKLNTDIHSNFIILPEKKE